MNRELDLRDGLLIARERHLTIKIVTAALTGRAFAGMGSVDDSGGVKDCRTGTAGSFRKERHG